MKKIVVTSGIPFIDIDAISCSIAYGELLNLKNKKVEVIHTGVLNSSITESVKSWGLNFKKDFNSENCTFVLVDVSDKDHFEKFVKLKQIGEIFDHRYGFEEFWSEKLGKNSHIEMVGSCATLIWEEFKKRAKPLKITYTSANLLYTAILSNTLNFKASVTTDRDTAAFAELEKFTKLPKDWVAKYFKEQETYILNDIKSAIINDTKILKPIIGQLELWESKDFIYDNLKVIEDAMNTFNSDEWFLTSPSISEGKNYLFTKNPKIKNLLIKTINAKFDGDIGTTKKLWLRKEIWRKIN